MIQKQRGLRPSPSEDETSLRQGSRRTGRRRFGPETSHGDSPTLSQKPCSVDHENFNLREHDDKC